MRTFYDLILIALNNHNPFRKKITFGGTFGGTLSLRETFGGTLSLRERDKCNITNKIIIVFFLYTSLPVFWIRFKKQKKNKFSV